LSSCYTSALSPNGTPWSPHRAIVHPRNPFSSASLVERDSIQPCNRGPSIGRPPTYAETPFSRAMARRLGTKPCRLISLPPMEESRTPPRARHLPPPQPSRFRIAWKFWDRGVLFPFAGGPWRRMSTIPEVLTNGVQSPERRPIFIWRAHRPRRRSYFKKSWMNAVYHAIRHGCSTVAQLSRSSRTAMPPRPGRANGGRNPAPLSERARPSTR